MKNDQHVKREVYYMVVTRKQIADPYRCSRGLYVAEAALEYFISILVTGAYLAKVTSAVGFFTTFLVSPLVDAIQANGGVFLGLRVYAQQVVSCFGLLLILALLVYMNTVMRGVGRQNGQR